MVSALDGRFKIDVLGTPITGPLLWESRQQNDHCLGNFDLLPVKFPNGVGISGYALVYYNGGGWLLDGLANPVRSGRKQP